MAKSDKLYSKSPKIEKDGDGKAKLKKPTEAAKTDIGTAGNPLEGANDEMPIDIHEQEHTAMYKRHQDEFSSMSERHLKDVKEMHKRHLEFNKQQKLSGTPGEDIKDKK